GRAQTGRGRSTDVSSGDVGRDAEHSVDGVYSPVGRRNAGQGEGPQEGIEETIKTVTSCSEYTRAVYAAKSVWRGKGPSVTSGSRYARGERPGPVWLWGGAARA